MNKQIDLPIADVQNSADTRRIAIDRVGIKAIRHPVRVGDKNGGVQHTVAFLICMLTYPIISRGRICPALWRFSIARNVRSR